MLEIYKLCKSLVTNEVTTDYHTQIWLGQYICVCKSMNGDLADDVVLKDAFDEITVMNWKAIP